MSLGGDDRTKHDANSSIGRSCNDTPPSESFTILDASTSVCINGPPSEIIASFTCCWNEHWEDADFWRWAWVDGNFSPGLLACVLIDMSLEMRGRKQE